MFKNESQIDWYIKKLKKYLCKTEAHFLNRLYFWSSHEKEYGIEKDGKIWIYNTLDQWADQLDVSKSSIRRAIKSLRDKKIICSNYLSANKRNRTLYYAINDQGICEYLHQISTASCAQKNDDCAHIKEHIDEHMDEHFNTVPYTELNKSNKSKNNKSSNQKKISSGSANCATVIPNVESSEIITSQKSTIAQDMIAIWQEEFPQSRITPTKKTARYLVASLQRKFQNSLEKWRNYLQRIKTSSYLMSEKFTIWISWVLKFETIDRIFNGEFGCQEPPKTPTEKAAEANKLISKAHDHIATLHEPEECLEIRKKLLQEEGENVYVEHMMEVSLDLIMVRYGSGREEKLITIASESDWTFKMAKRYLEQCRILRNFSVDDQNHYCRQLRTKESAECARIRDKMRQILGNEYDKWEDNVTLVEKNGCFNIWSNDPSFNMTRNNFRDTFEKLQKIGFIDEDTNTAQSIGAENDRISTTVSPLTNIADNLVTSIAQKHAAVSLLNSFNCSCG
ncbi:MAG: helix-turn-helix domain-containing protein [Lactobacillales bacterium]|jgi:DNA-binding transcriptional ArsR family regulator|nr:helix-turn-helix domain-containing protein [Lactobacillales bacterium]